MVQSGQAIRKCRHCRLYRLRSDFFPPLSNFKNYTSHPRVKVVLDLVFRPTFLTSFNANQVFVTLTSFFLKEAPTYYQPCDGHQLISSLLV